MNSISEVKEELIKLGFREISIMEEIKGEIGGFVFCVYSKENSYHGDNIHFRGMSGYLWPFMYKEDTNEFDYWKDNSWVAIEETLDIPSMIVLYK